MKQASLSIETFLSLPEGAEVEPRLACRVACPASDKRGRRGLVLTDERARHPFRASLPPSVRDELHDIPAESLWRLTADDVRGFASTYFAVFAAVLVFIM
ncbi:MAG: hypothetical protein ACX930_04030 [Erythrobacter sp.]